MISGRTPIFKHFLGSPIALPSTVWRRNVESGQAGRPGTHFFKATILAFGEPIPIEDPDSMNRPPWRDCRLLATDDSPSRRLRPTVPGVCASGANS